MPQHEQPSPASESGDDQPIDEVSRMAVASDATPHDERVAELLAHTIDVNVLAGAVERQEAADAADTLETLEGEEAVEVLEQMEDAAAAEALAEMQMPLAVSVLGDLIDGDPAYAGRLLELMAPDDAADLLQAVDQPRRHVLLGRIRSEPAEQLIELAGYHSESAGGIMTTDVLALPDDMTVGEAIEYIRGVKPSENVNHAMVVDADRKLVGLITLRDILLIDNAERIADHMERELDVISPDLDREAVAHTFDRYDYAVLPVVADDGRLLGIVTVDDVIDIIREEQTEDVQRSVGAGKGEAVYSTLLEKIRGRLGWLGMSLGMMCGSAAVIIMQEEIVADYLLLAFLLPVIAAVVGNGGQQAMMVTLRGIVLNEIRQDRVWPLLARELGVGVVNGIALGVAIYVGVAVLAGFGLQTADTRIGLVAGVAMTVAMAVATLTGTGIPLIMRRVGIDPAMASSIILIMITDFVSFCALLLLTRALLPGLGGV